MNEPFISPWLIWLIGASSNLAITVSLVAALTAVGLVIALVMHAAETGLEWNPDWGPHEIYRAACVKWIIGCVIALLVAQVIPSRETAAAMLIASKATPANYEAIKVELIGIVGGVREGIE